MTKRSLLAATGLIGVGLVCGVILMTSTNAIQSLFAAGTNLGAGAPPAVAPDAVKALNNQFVAVSNAVTKSVVSITVKVERKGMGAQFPKEFYRFFGPDAEEMTPEDQAPQEGEAGGSGVIITTDGYVVTNNHVVEEAKEGGITVTTEDQKEYKAKLVGRDPLTDLAVLKIEGTFTPAHFAERKNIRIGEWVIAVGSPLGLKSTVTTGIVSAMGRGIGIVGTNERSFARNRYAVENFIQTDAAINPGNSGGGLFNLDGSLVGINTAIASQSGFNQGYGFAIPIDMVKSVALDLMDDGKIQRGYVGVEISSVDEATAKAVGLSNVSGVTVNRVVKDGAAERAGIEVGDIILDVDGTPVKTSNDLQNQIVLRKAGDKVNLKIWRDGNALTKSVTLKALDGDANFASADPDATAGGSSDNDAAPVSFKALGFTAAALNKTQRDEFDTENGVMVSKVEARGTSARRGLRQGVVILKADGKQVTSPSQLKAVLAKKQTGDGVLLVVKDKDGARQAITLLIPEDNS